MSLVFEASRGPLPDTLRVGGHIPSRTGIAGFSNRPGATSLPCVRECGGGGAVRTLRSRSTHRFSKARSTPSRDLLRGMATAIEWCAGGDSNPHGTQGPRFLRPLPNQFGYLRERAESSGIEPDERHGRGPAFRAGVAPCDGLSIRVGKSGIEPDGQKRWVYNPARLHSGLLPRVEGCSDGGSNPEPPE